MKRMGFKEFTSVHAINPFINNPSVHVVSVETVSNNIVPIYRVWYWTISDGSVNLSNAADKKNQL